MIVRKIPSHIREKADPARRRFIKATVLCLGSMAAFPFLAGCPAAPGQERPLAPYISRISSTDLFGPYDRKHDEFFFRSASRGLPMVQIFFKKPLSGTVSFNYHLISGEADTMEVSFFSGPGPAAPAGLLGTARMYPRQQARQFRCGVPRGTQKMVIKAVENDRFNMRVFDLRFLD